MFGNFIFFAKFRNSVSQKCFVMQIFPIALASFHLYYFTLILQTALVL